jgi:hypothetical protein
MTEQMFNIAKGVLLKTPETRLAKFLTPEFTFVNEDVKNFA